MQIKLNLCSQSKPIWIYIVKGLRNTNLEFRAFKLKFNFYVFIFLSFYGLNLDFVFELELAEFDI